MGHDQTPVIAKDEALFALAADQAETDSRRLGGTLERKPIAEQVTARIMAMIKSGNLKSGDRLPTEAQMCVAFGISRPPLREALKALTLMGVLESRQGGRYTVTDLSPTRMVAPFNAMLSVTEYDLTEHFEARALVDLELTRLCAIRATDAERQKIRRLALDGRAFYDDPVAFRLLDIEFHRAINEPAGNALIFALAQGLYDIGLDMRRVASTLPGVIPVSVAQHCEVADAICDRDPDAAAAAYRRHLEHVVETTVRAIELTGGREIDNA
jgi:GntR family transcriptional repressor for pyruvate dehydrogenase complex